MKRSTERILTTHTGSLPRPDDLLPLIKAMEAGNTTDVAGFDTRVRSAVAEIVRKQVEAGVDVVNDGEAGKPSYATYVKDRLSGFGAEASTELLPGIADLNDYPEYGERFRSQRAVADLKRPACDGPVAYRNRKDVDKELENLKAAVAQAKPTEAFMSAASPGVISIFLPNSYYKTHEAYLAALADAMKTEYNAIHQAGIILQVDCPDLAMGRHIQFPDASLSEFRKNIERHVEALNHALIGYPARSRPDPSMLGQLRGPASSRRPPARYHRHRFQGPRRRNLLRGVKSAPRARMGGIQGRQAARGQTPDPGRDRFDQQLHRASGIDRAAHL